MPNRRTFLKMALAGTAVSSLSGDLITDSGPQAAKEQQVTFSLNRIDRSKP
ncbi:MAG: twin-arginine translocation signal domain-containing protein [bacterium]|jgi:hypothetical protein